MTSKVEGTVARRKPPNAGKGRPKGSLNKTTAAAKTIISEVANRLGGADRMLEWAKESPDNEKVFWASIYPRLLPLEVNASGSFTVNLPKHTGKL